MTITRRDAGRGIAAILGTGMTIGASGARAQSRGGTLTCLLANEPPMLTSAFNTALPLGTIATKVLEGLLAYDAQMNPSPALATSWAVSPDGLAYTFRLRSGVKWHDGRDFTSADVAFSAISVWKELHPRGRAVFANLTAVETPDAQTAVFRLSAPSPVLLSALHAYESQVLPRHLYEGTDIQNNPANNAPIGTGPFRFREWRRGQFILLERSPDYWDAGKPLLDRVIFRVMTDAGARSAAMENGSVDIGFWSPVSLAETERLRRLRHIEVTTSGYEYASPMFFMELNLRRPPLDNVMVRRAMMHAIDRQFIIENIFLNYAEPVTGPIPRSSPFYTADVRQYPFNPRLANEMLDAAGVRRGANGIRFSITHDPVPQGDEHAQSADYVKQALSEVGINVDVRRQDLASQIRRVSTWDFDMSSNPLFAMFDPALGVNRLFWSENIRQGTPFTNVSGFRNAEIDQIIARQGSERDPAARRALYHRFQQIIMDEVPLLYLLEVKYATIANRRVRNHTADGAAAFGNFANISIEGR
jgi:peptide/nickel transport system substrate-binding protein